MMVVVVAQHCRYYDYSFSFPFSYQVSFHDWTHVHSVVVVVLVVLFVDHSSSFVADSDESNEDESKC